MNISKTWIEKPVLTIVLSLVFILLGLLGFMQLNLSDNPSVFRPTLDISVEVPGSSSASIEKNVTIPLENQLQTTPYLSFIYSNSTQGFANIHLFFKNITPQEFVTAQSMVLEGVNQVTLPGNAKTPQIQTAGNTGMPLMFFAVSDSTMGQHALVDYVKNNIVRPLQQVQGVGNVSQYSTSDALRINLDPTQMAEKNISVTQVIQYGSNVKFWD